jgi:Putative zinc-finger
VLTEPLCQLLNDFLAHDLAGDERQRFVEHLAGCPACREAVAENQRLTGRLIEAVERMEPVPSALAGRVERRIRVVRRRRIAFAALALAASVALIAVWLQRPVEPPPIAKNSGPLVAELTPRVRVAFPDKNLIAVPVESESRNVTVLLVYPGLRSELPTTPERNER